jgi:hypothetical protein
MRTLTTLAVAALIAASGFATSADAQSRRGGMAANWLTQQHFPVMGDISRSIGAFNSDLSSLEALGQLGSNAPASLDRLLGSHRDGQAQAEWGETPVRLLDMFYKGDK